MLKHAAEEFRHAHYLKFQIKKLCSSPPKDYQDILGSHYTKRYLDKIELSICKLTDKMVYPLVTYAIEKRAQKLYPIYQEVLRKEGSKVMVMSIIKEEEGHLDEMEKILDNHPLKQTACEIEQSLYKQWVNSICSVFNAL